MLCTMQIALYNCQEGKQTRPHVMPVRQDVSLCAHLGHRTLPSVDGVSCFTLSRKRWFIGFLDIADANFMRNVHNLKRSFSYYFFVLCLYFRVYSSTKPKPSRSIFKAKTWSCTL